MSRSVISSSTSRVLRIGGIACAAFTSIATFGGSSDWEIHEQLDDDTPVQLSASSATWSDVFRGSGSGTGAKRLRLDGAIELTPSEPLAAPVRVRLTLVPAGSSEPLEEIVFVTQTQVFTAVNQEVRCEPDTVCLNEGTFSVEVMDASALGSATLALHWVSTASLTGDGPTRPADASLTLAQP